MIYLINHSEVIDEPYFKSESGKKYQMGDKRINCLIKWFQPKSDKPIYRSGHIKLNEIGYRYKLVEDKYNDNNKIVIEEMENTKNERPTISELTDSVVVSGGNINHPEQYKPLNDEDNLKIPFIYHKPIPISEIDFSEPKPMMNPITYDLINPELWEDGLHLQPNIMSENFEINMIYEVKDKKVVRVYKSKV